MLDLYLQHGRRSPEDNLEDWGFDGPRLPNVVGIHETYRCTLRILFADAESAKHAQRATGWQLWDDCELEATIADDMLSCDYRGSRAYFGDWGLIQPESQRHAHSARLRALEKAYTFIAGFEGDAMQDGIDELLTSIRAAMGRDPAALPRASNA